MSDIETPDSSLENPEGEGTPEGAADTDWVKEAKKWEKRSRENYAALQAAQAAAEKWTAHEEAQKTEAQKLADKLAEYESKEKTAQAELIRYKVATSKSLPPELVARLKGETLEELEADADALLELIGGVSKGKPNLQPVKTQGQPSGAAPISARQAFIEAFDNQ